MEKDVISLLYTIYNAGFNHGANEGNTVIPEHGTLDAFNRLIKGESPLEDGVSYDIKEKVDELTKSLMHKLTDHYRELMVKNYKYQMGDDDFEPTTKEYQLMTALSEIFANLSQNNIKS